MASISRECILLISTPLKCLIYAILENSSYDKTLSKRPYLPDVFVLFINLINFVIIDKSFFSSRCRLVSVNMEGQYICLSLEARGSSDLESVTAEKCNGVTLV